MLKYVLRFILSALYKVEVRGLEHYKEAGERVIMVANHLSFLDALLIALYVPEKPMFAINKHIAQRWYIKPFLKLVKAFPLDSTNPMATKAIIHEIRENAKCVIFPEGRITVTGSLMKIYEGPGMIADKSDAKILPIRIDGAQYTPFSRLKGKVRMRLFPEITLTFLAPRTFHVADEIKGRARRHAASMKLYDLMSQMLFESSDYKKPLFQSLLDEKHIHGRFHEIAEDAKRQPVNYGQFIMRSFILGKKLAEVTAAKEFVGFMLPNSVASVISFFALQAYGRVPAMLNFSVGEKNLISACKTAEIKTVVTAKEFIEAAKLEDIIAALKKNDIDVIYLENIVPKVSLGDKLLGLFQSFFPQTAFYHINKTAKQSHEDVAVILFTSGSEGAPKGVVLTHDNIQANRYQLASRVDFGPTDIVFNALPIFHSFGLTAGTLLPLLSGIKTFFYPSPLHYRIVPELVYDTNATIMFGTNTFLAGYARYANPYDFYAIRYVFAGAEKLKDEVRKIWSEKYGVRILEGYGATETSPVISINTPMHNKLGSVGRLLPAINYKIEAVDGIDEGGKLIVNGPNIMKGYLLNDKPGKLQPPANSGYDTGDIVTVDEEGYITIKGRAKRFAKVAGEMISLTAVESYIGKLWPDHQHAVVTVEDKKKGEALVLVTENEKAKRSEMSKYAKKIGLSELYVPRKIEVLNKLPVLGSGKLDYKKVEELVEND